MAPLIVLTSLYISQAIIAEATLSFLGLGTQPPQAAWGNMLAIARGFIDSSVWMSLFPGLAIMITVLGFNFLGDGLRDILDPRIGADLGERRGRSTRDARALMLDLLVRDALVVDGTGAPPFRGDVAVEDGRIAAVGDLDGRRAPSATIDADGRMVCPGFVDPHSHSDFTLLTVPDRRQHGPAGRHDRGRRQLRLDVRAGHARVASAFIEARLRTFAYEGPVEWEHLRRAPLASSSTSATRRTSPGSSATTPSATPPACFEPQATEEQLRADGGRSSPRRWTPARSASRPGLEFNPGRAGADRRDRPPEQGRRPLRRLLHEPRPQPRLSGCRTRSTSS